MGSLPENEFEVLFWSEESVPKAFVEVIRTHLGNYFLYTVIYAYTCQFLLEI